MRKSVLIGFLVILLAGLVSPAPVQAQGAKPLKLRFAAAGLGSAYYVYAAAIADLLKPHLPAGSTIDILPSPGGVANTILVADGRAEIGVTPAPSVRWALDGTVSFKTKLETVRGIYGDMDEFYVASIVTKKSGIRSFEGIKEKKFPLRLMTVPVGGNGEIAARHLLEAYGMSYDMLKSWGGSITHTSRTAITDALKDGHADAFIHTVGPGHPAVGEIVVSTDVRFIPVSTAVINQLAGKYGYTRDRIKANDFKTQDYEVPTIGCPTIMIVNKNLPDDVAYWLAKVLAENKERLVVAHAALKVFEPAEAWKKEKMWADQHPGAMKYFRERGWAK
jgi:TRAP transporter TAXI family solute receptor